MEARLVTELGSSLFQAIQEQGVLAHYISMEDEAPTIRMVHERVANLVKQISHRYAHMHILEIGTYSGGLE